MPTTIPGSGSVILDPGFFERLSVKTETGRVGLAGWTSPNSPRGPGLQRDQRLVYLGSGLHVVLASPAREATRQPLTGPLPRRP